MDPSRWKQIKDAYTDALEMDDGARAAFIVSLPQEIGVEVEKLAAADQLAKGFIANPFLVERGSVRIDASSLIENRKIDDYDLIETIGTGGMGTVYLAEHRGDGFSQKVAIKLIKRGMDTSAVLKRFLMERQILASLEHPNIARMLDGGSTADGVPYFVMEYIGGRPIRSYCDDRDLEVRSRVELFAKVCAAVSYAHQKLVVHRDLKPSNILVTEDGEPKLLDFGIAKLLQPDWKDTAETVTATQFRILTPEYSSPEQLRGEATTTSTDVYSLGVVLYELLTGIRPFQREGKDPQSLADAIQTKDPQKPSIAALFGHSSGDADARKTSADFAQATGEEKTHGSTRRSVPDPKSLRGDLDNIVLKAIRSDTERRYSSVQELLEDIRRYLDGLPVKATADSAAYRFGKFFKRHKTVVLGATAAVLLLIGTTAVTGWQYLEAKRERARAERQFEETRSLSKSVLYELHDAIEPLQGSTAARELLVSKAAEYLDRLAGENSTDPYLQTELADAYQRIGDIQGGLWRSNLGQRENAEASYAKSFAIRKALVEAGNTDPKLRWKLAQGYSKLADISYSQADPDRFLENSRQALELLIPLEGELGSDDDFLIDLAAGYGTVARGTALKGNFEGGIQSINKSIQVLEGAVGRNPTNKSLVDALSTIYDYAAEINSSNGRKQEALELFKKGLTQTERAVTLAPTDLVIRRNLIASYILVSETECEVGNCLAALEQAEKAVSMINALVKSDPQNADFALVSRAAELNKGKILVTSKSYAQAMETLTPVLATSEKLADADKEDKILEFSVANVRHQLGRAYLGSGIDDKSALSKMEKLKKAEGLLRTALEVFKRFRDSGITTGEDAALTDLAAADVEKCQSELNHLKIR